MENWELIVYLSVEIRWCLGFSSRCQSVPWCTLWTQWGVIRCPHWLRFTTLRETPSMLTVHSCCVVLVVSVCYNCSLLSSQAGQGGWSRPSPFQPHIWVQTGERCASGVQVHPEITLCLQGWEKRTHIHSHPVPSRYVLFNDQCPTYVPLYHSIPTGTHWMTNPQGVSY